MSRPKLQSSMMATVRCLFALCIFGLLFGSEVAAMRATQKESKSTTAVQRAGKAPQGKYDVHFGITGNIEDLYPGASAPLKVRVNNSFEVPLEVRFIKMRVEDSDQSGCGREWIEHKRSVEISRLVPPKSASYVSYPMRMHESAPAACMGAAWELIFQGTGAVSPQPSRNPDDNVDDDTSGNGHGNGDASGDGSVLPFTGGDLIPVIALSLALILAGVFLLALRRSRADES